MGRSGRLQAMVSSHGFHIWFQYGFQLMRCLNMRRAYAGPLRSRAQWVWRIGTPHHCLPVGNVSRNGGQQMTMDWNWVHRAAWPRNGSNRKWTGTDWSTKAILDWQMASNRIAMGRQNTGPGPKTLPSWGQQHPPGSFCEYLNKTCAMFWYLRVYPLVNLYITIWKITIFGG